MLTAQSPIVLLEGTEQMWSLCSMPLVCSEQEYFPMYQPHRKTPKRKQASSPLYTISVSSKEFIEKIFSN